MMAYIWLGIYGFALMFLITLSVNSIAARFLRKFPDSKPISFISGYVLIAFYLIIALLSPVSALLPFRMGLFFLILCAVQLTLLKTTGIYKEFSLFLLSLISVFFIPSEMPIFQTIFPAIVYPLLGTSLYLIVRVFTAMDKVPSLSLITVFTQGILYFFVARLGFFGIDISHAVFYLMISALTVSQLMKVITGSCVLGKYAASVTGFVLGYFSIYVMAKGTVFVPLILFSYDIFEIFLATLLTIITTHRFYPRTVPYLVETAMATDDEPKKLIRYLFLMCVGLVFSAYIIINQPEQMKAATVLVLLILVAMYMRLKNWGKKTPSFKDLKSDLKQGLKELKEQLNNIPLKKEKPQKKMNRKPKKGSKK